jgi:hypothetical protein
MPACGTGQSQGTTAFAAEVHTFRVIKLTAGTFHNDCTFLNLISFNICAKFFKIYLGDIKSDDTMGKMSRKGLNLMDTLNLKGEDGLVQ